MAVMDSNEPFNPITGLAGGAAIGAMGAGGYIGAQAISNKRLPERYEKTMQKAKDLDEKRLSYYPQSPNHEKYLKKEIKTLDKAAKQKTKMENHPYLKMGGAWKKTGIVAASAAGAGLIGTGAGYANVKWGD